MNYDKALDAVKQQIRPPEKALSWQKTNYRGRKKNSLLSGALMVTNQRVIFLGSQMMEQASFSIPLNTITSIDNHRQKITTYTRITSAGVVHEFMALAPNLLSILNQARAGGFQTPAPAPAAAAPPTAGVGEQLQQLTTLHASGALSAAEFAAAKARLLGL